MTDPYYSDDFVTLYHGDCREVTEWLEADVVASDPPYPNNADHFVDSVPHAEEALRMVTTGRVFWFWHQLNRPSTQNLSLVAVHAWHRTNTNRPDNYEAVYEFSDKDRERPSRVLPFPVVYPGLTGCKEATGHPTQKPVRLMSALLEMRGEPGTIADPFAGSGSTLVAAKRLGRKAIGVEIDERYCEIAARRLAQGVLDFGATP